MSLCFKKIIVPVMSPKKAFTGVFLWVFICVFQTINKVFTDCILPLDGGKKRP